MRSRQFCSVCKDWLDMEVVPTSDGGEDDGVIWFRCPQCQGFLPKLSGSDLEDDTGKAAADDSAAETEPAGATSADAEDDAMPWDSPADMMAAQQAAADQKPAAPGPFLPEDEAPPDADPDDESVPERDGAEVAADTTSEEPPPPSEPIPEYAAMLAALDVSESTPYRPWETYQVGQCIHHLAWDDCGVVVGKEDLPGGRKIIKCYFEEAGVVRLIEQAPR